MPIINYIKELPFYDAFISYSQADEKIASRIAEDLNKNHFDVFFDKWCIAYGQDNAQILEFALKKSNKIIAIMSRESLKSDLTLLKKKFSCSEIYLKHKIKLLPIIVQKCEIPEEIKRQRNIDFTDKKYNSNLSELISAIKNISNLKIGPFRIFREECDYEWYIDFIIKKISFYFANHCINNVRLAFVEIVNNAFKHTKSTKVTITINITAFFVSIYVTDYGKGFNLFETIGYNKKVLRKNPFATNGRGLLLLMEVCSHLENKTEKPKHTMCVVINKEKSTLHVNNYKYYLQTNSNTVTYFNRTERIWYIRICGRNKSYFVFRKIMLQVLNPKSKKYIWDLLNVDFIDLDLLGGLAWMFRILINLFGKKYRPVLVVRDEIKRYLETSNFDKVIYICPDLETAKKRVLTYRKTT